MPKDLTNKVANLLSDIERLNKHEAIRVVENFINTELNYLRSEHFLSESDLYQIKGLANSAWQDTQRERTSETNKDMSVVMNWVEATASFLASQGLLAARIKFKK